MRIHKILESSEDLQTVGGPGGGVQLGVSGVPGLQDSPRAPQQFDR